MNSSPGAGDEAPEFRNDCNLDSGPEDVQEFYGVGIRRAEMKEKLTGSVEIAGRRGIIKAGYAARQIRIGCDGRQDFVYQF